MVGTDISVVLWFGLKTERKLSEKYWLVLLNILAKINFYMINFVASWKYCVLAH